MELADRQNEIVQMCWNDDDQSEICVGRRDYTVSIFSTTTNSVVNTFHFVGGTGVIKGLCKTDSDYVTCSESGCLRVWSAAGQQKLEIAVGNNICCMRNNAQQRHLVATAGNENTLKLWTLERPESPVFAAKNVRHDWLNLRVPEWYTDVGFLPDSQCLVTCTNGHEVRVYDPRSSVRRPVLFVSYDDCPMTTLCVQPNSSHGVFVGNSHGSLALIDLRNKGKVAQLYKGAEASIRSISCHTTEPVVAACGLDRFVRIYDIKSRQLLQKFYLKSRLNCLLFSGRTRPLHAGDNEEAAMDIPTTPSDVGDNVGESCEDSLWSNMARVVDRSKCGDEVARKRRNHDDAAGSAETLDTCQSELTKHSRRRRMKSDTSAKKLKKTQRR